MILGGVFFAGANHTVLSIAIIALVCILAGLIANTLIAERLVNVLESSVLPRIPAHAYLKQGERKRLGRR
jgi:hypothetical protein